MHTTTEILPSARRRRTRFFVLLLAAALPAAAEAQVRLPEAWEDAAAGYERLESRFDQLYEGKRYREAVAVGDTMVRYHTAMLRRQGESLENDLVMPELLRRVAQAHAELGNLAVADSLFRVVHAALDRLWDPADPDAFTELYSILLVAREKRMPLAETLLPAVLARAERVYEGNPMGLQAIRYDLVGEPPETEEEQVAARGRDTFDDLVAAGQLDAAAALGDTLILRAEQAGGGPELLEWLEAVANVHRKRGDVQAADRLYLRAMALRQTGGAQAGPFASLQGAPWVASERADAYHEAGLHPAADSLRQVAMQMYRAAEGPRSPSYVVQMLVWSGELMDRDPARADSLYRLAVKLGREADTSDFIAHQTMVFMLGSYAGMRGEHARADTLLRTSAMAEAGEPDPMLQVRIAAARGEGRHAEADSLLRHYEKELRAAGPEWSELLLVPGLLDQAVHYEAEGRMAEGLRVRARVADLLERERGSMSGLLEVEGLDASAPDHLMHGTVALNAGRPDDGEVTALGLTLVLRYKGREQDVESDALALSRGNPRAAAWIDSLAAARARLSALASRGPGAGDTLRHRTAMARAYAQQARLAQTLGEPEEDGPVVPSVSLADVQAAVPPGAVLVELVGYESTPRYFMTPADPPAPRYGAYLLARAGPPRFVDLGPAAPVDSLVTRFRAALAAVDTPAAAELSRRLGDALLRPLRLDGETRHLLVSPDGLLNLVPFAALTADDGAYLVQRHLVTYLTSGRDLLRLAGRSAPAQGPPLVVANPDFGRAGPGAAEPGAGGDRGGGDLRADLSSLWWRPLPGTAGEAAALREILPGARFAVDTQATESLIKGTARPRILHVATHGFFLADPDRQDGTVGGALLRAGLALAGANPRDGGSGEDGVLTGLEVSGLDLRGTELVVLSACETGLGRVGNGGGVYGLRRALVLAGARAQLTTLWRVNDAATRDAMKEYYERLSQGEPRGEALRQVQLGMLESGGRAHPAFWAAFIPAGDWGSLPPGVLAPAAEEAP